MTSKVLQQLNLAQGALSQDLLAEDIRDLLDCNAFVGLGINGGTAVAAPVSAVRGRCSDGEITYHTIP
jgi:hypothetical protein